ncbi:MAG: glucose-methanol-choline oxidoreductase [Candidatus Magnetoglobus multicellularis str. Araruama]|uniref:Glucose-methanol-choline oxidoreductase n=1 Tax=Candidatus Magnetoglobus multicellularis str. Araruama TaxID=890399 RepID=A0A1V1P7W2_9BACT|nr:MAG: glucose-methanol-choline oxidoreductase [Candidatus Magnetoglobus multicellularis str. Araruama]
MFNINIRTGERDMKKNIYDIIIVGSGPGGATVARELAQKKQKVLLLERGNSDAINGKIFQAFTNTGLPFKNVLFTHNMLAMVRSTTVGGSTIYYYATAFDPPFDMLKKYGVDISLEINEAKKELPIAPLKKELQGPMTRRIMDTARDMGYEWNPLNKLVYQDKCRPNCDLCNIGCPYGAKWTAREFVDEAEQNGATIVTNANVKKIIFDGTTAVGVSYRRHMIPEKAYGKKIVISAGGIGTPVILGNSGFQSVGKDYFFDPLIVAFGEVKDIKGGKEFPMAAGCHFSDDHYMMTDMTIPLPLYLGFTAEVFRFDRLASHSRTLTIMVKEKDRLGGYLTSRGGVRKKLDPADKRSLLHGYDRAKEILKKAGAKNIYKGWYTAAHPGGTAKINDIVDTDLKTEYDNLYVCDCSVIPESFGLPPTLTLIGLGKRLAKHLS